MWVQCKGELSNENFTGLQQEADCAVASKVLFSSDWACSLPICTAGQSQMIQDRTMVVDNVVRESSPYLLLLPCWISQVSPLHSSFLLAVSVPTASIFGDLSAVRYIRRLLMSEPNIITMKSIGAHHFHFTLAGSSSPNIRAFRCLKIAQGSSLFFRQFKLMFLIISQW